MVDTEPKLQLVFLASVEKGFTPEVGQRLLDAVKASFVEAFDAEAVEQAPELGLSSSFAPQLRALHVLAAHQARFSAEYEDRLLSAMALRQAQADSPPAHRDAKAEPLLKSQFSVAKTAPTKEFRPVDATAVERTNER